MNSVGFSSVGYSFGARSHCGTESGLAGDSRPETLEVNDGPMVVVASTFSTFYFSPAFVLLQVATAQLHPPHVAWENSPRLPRNAQAMLSVPRYFLDFELSSPAIAYALQLNCVHPLIHPPNPILIGCVSCGLLRFQIAVGYGGPPIFPTAPARPARRLTRGDLTFRSRALSSTHCWQDISARPSPPK